ncbi:Protein of unknown function [Gryllus bimaculatus]|nr:Protein of unknown function [Gryllus bimaculatus]
MTFLLNEWTQSPILQMKFTREGPETAHARNRLKLPESRTKDGIKNDGMAEAQQGIEKEERGRRRAGPSGVKWTTNDLEYTT